MLCNVIDATVYISTKIMQYSAITGTAKPQLQNQLGFIYALET